MVCAAMHADGSPSFTRIVAAASTVDPNIDANPWTDEMLYQWLVCHDMGQYVFLLTCI